MTKTIHLTKDQQTIVDDEDYEKLSKHSWYITNKGYAARSTRVPFRKTVLMHVEIIKPPKGKQVDHINRNPLDNRKVNLRIVTNYENSTNRKISKNSTTRINGVSPLKSGKYQAYITIKGKRKYLGVYSDLESAKTARQEAEEKFGFLNR